MGTLDRARLHEQIAEHYRSEIRAGRLAPGAQLLATRPLAKTWEVSKQVASDAVALLRDEGWIITRPGKPAVVADHPPTEEAAPDNPRQSRTRHLWGSNPGPPAAVEEA